VLNCGRERKPPLALEMERDRRNVLEDGKERNPVSPAAPGRNAGLVTL
jgi:hypothetical protein